MTPEQVSEHLRAILQSMKKKFNRVQIIVYEITPRHDDKDENVKRCNELINSICEDKDYITIVYDTRFSGTTTGHYTRT